MPAELTVDVAGQRVRVSSLDRVLFPATGFTKAELVDYYVHVADALLPHLGQRPLTLHRYPEGVGGPHFFQTRTPPHPDWVQTATMHFPRTGKTFEAPVIDDLPSLVWAANLSAIELHPFLGRVADLGTPTVVVFDLDPGAPAELVEACAVALRLRALLDDASLASYPKTSGAKGIHVVVPLNTPTTYDETKALARTLARTLTADDPAGVTDRMTRALRPGKVFVDWSQNDAGKSTVAPYSLRALRVPTASVPLVWAEIEAVVRDRDARGLPFTIDALRTRLAQSGDLHARVLTQRQRLRRR
ncbi:MAG: non-homologous end-joining DNA ligase [Mycobacteriales bacterium]